MKSVSLDLKIPVTFFKEGDSFIAYSPVLDVSTSAATYDKAQERFDEVVKIFFEELVASGTLDDVLSSLGWSKLSNQWIPPMPIGSQITDISIPLPN